MYKKILRSFVIGSSMLVTISHYDSLRNYINNKMAYNKYDEDKKLKLFYFYVIFAPVYYGLTNCLITYLRLKFKFNIHYLYLFFSLLLPSFTVLHNLYLKILWDSYLTGLNTSEKIKYAAGVYFKYFINLNFIIKSFELYFN